MGMIDVHSANATAGVYIEDLSFLYGVYWYSYFNSPSLLHLGLSTQ